MVVVENLAVDALVVVFATLEFVFARESILKLVLGRLVVGA